MAITASLVKELRERTGAGMMECKKALVETNGDIEAAIESMRKSGMAKADKKADRVAADGIVAIQADMDKKNAVIFEINSETDFVAKGEDFQNFVNAVVATTLASKPADIEALNALTVAGGATVDEARRALIAKIGENISLRRFTVVSTTGVIGAYSHGSRIGVVVDMEGGDEALAKDVAMHIAASKPACISADQMPGDVIEKEREIFTAQAAESGKPADIVAKMVDGRIAKFLKENTLEGQPFVKDPDQTVGQLLKAANAKVISFQRYEVGEGIEKAVDDFAAEVAAQVAAAKS